MAYFGGFFSGEGCFLLSGLTPSAVIKLRGDDRSILELFADRFGLGFVRDHPAYDNPNPSVTWTVLATDELAPAVELFEAAELRGRKRREFEVWRDAAHERAFAKIGGRRWDRQRVQLAADRLKELRVYRTRQDAVDQTVPQDARDVYVAVLRAFSAEEPAGELTSTAYQRARARHPEWPTRNTIAMAFGSWANALDAAGLGSRVTDWARDRAR